MCESVYSRLEERYMLYSKGIHYKWVWKWMYEHWRQSALVVCVPVSTFKQNACLISMYIAQLLDTKWGLKSPNGWILYFCNFIVNIMKCITFLESMKQIFFSEFQTILSNVHYFTVYCIFKMCAHACSHFVMYHFILTLSLSLNKWPW